MSTLEKGDKIIDSRDIIAAIKSLEEEREAAFADIDTSPGDRWTSLHGQDFGANWTEDQEDEYQELVALEEEASSYSADWRYGAALIHDDYFEEYAEQLAKDLGLLKDTKSWPHTCIDWEQAAEELQQDYTEVDFGGETYWIRA